MFFICLRIFLTSSYHQAEKIRHFRILIIVLLQSIKQIAYPFIQLSFLAKSKRTKFRLFSNIFAIFEQKDTLRLYLGKLSAQDLGKYVLENLICSLARLRTLKFKGSFGMVLSFSSQIQSYQINCA